MNGRLAIALTALVTLALGFAGPANAAPADPDLNFSGDGIFTTTDYSPNVFGQSVVLDSVFLPDGDLITVGAASSPQRWHLERINSDGTMDSGFGGGDGKITLDIAPTYTASLSPVDSISYARAVKLDGDGKLVVAGQVGAFGGAETLFAVARFNTSDGSLDSTFNSTGDDPGANYFKIKNQSGQQARAYDLGFTSDDKIILAGEAEDVSSPLSGGSPNFDYAWARLNANGTLDTTLEGDGTALKSVIANVSETAFSVSVQSDDKPVLAGSTRDPDFPLLGAFGLVRFNTNGSFDTSFGTRGDGRAFLTGTGGGTVRMQQQSNGRFVVSGAAESGLDCQLARFDEFGQLDLTFDGDGTTIVDFDGEADQCEDLAIDAAGRIVIGGRGFESGETGDPQFVVARLTGDGQLDSAFDSDGRKIFSLTVEDDGVDSVSINPANGEIALGGFRNFGASVTGVVVMLEGGAGTPFQPTLPTPLALDPTFDFDGKVVTDASNGPSDQINDSVVQSDGKIVSVGFLRTAFGSPPFTTFQQDVAVMRHNVDGSLDSSFGGGDGIATFSADNAYSGDVANAVTLQSDGKIVVVGSTTLQGAGNEFLIGRLNTDGSLDNTFGDGGDGVTWVNYDTNYGDGANAVVVLSDDSIVAAGQTDSGGTDLTAFIKFTSAGLLDTGWAGNGVLEAEVVGGTNDDRALDMVEQPDGKLLAVGYAVVGGERDLSFVRIDATGSFDTSLNATTGSEGRKTLDIGVGNDVANAVAIDADSKIVVAGTTFNGSDDDLFVARFDENVNFDVDFGSGGVATRSYDANSIDDQANDMLIEPDGKIVVAGSANYGVGADFALARFNADGSPDTTFDGDGAGSTPVGSSSETAYAVERMADGRIVASGKMSDGSALDSALIRLGDAPQTPAPPAQPPGPAAASWKTTITSPKHSKRYRAKRFKKFSGKVEVTGATVARVQVAVRKIDKRRCLWLRSTKAKYRKLRIKNRRCTSKRWLNVKVSTSGKWSLTMKRRLGKGRYEVFARAILSDGSTDTKFVRKINHSVFTLK